MLTITFSNAEPSESTYDKWELNSKARAFEVGNNNTTFLVSGTLRTKALVKEFVSICFRPSGFPTAEYAQHLNLDDNWLTPSHTVKLGISIDDKHTMPTVTAVMKQFRDTIPMFADATIQQIYLHLQGLTTSPLAEMCPRTTPSLHVLVSLWKQSPFSFMSDRVDGKGYTSESEVTLPPLDIADFVITDFGRTRLMSVRGVDGTQSRLYSGALWIELSVPESSRGHLTPVMGIPHGNETMPLCGRCGQWLPTNGNRPNRPCASCGGNALICDTCYVQRSRATGVDEYVLEMNACGRMHALAIQLTALLVDGMIKVSCSCNCSTWPQ
jgi:hypothetical protein